MKKKYLAYVITAVLIIGALAVAWSLGNAPETEDVTVTNEQHSLKNQEVDEEKISYEKNPEESMQEKQETTPAETKTPAVDVATEETVEEVSNKTLCALTVDCSDILNDIETLEEEKRSLITENGIIFSLGNIEFTEGESAFDVLKREMRKAGIPLEFSLTPVYNTAYIEGINNIYEFDCGERSGWKYSVNGLFPPISCSDYKLNNGDKIVLIYKIKGY